jgi:beta-glucosidase
LLENNGVLPLNKKKVKSIAVLGPMAHGFMNVSFYTPRYVNLKLATDKM